MYLPESNYEKLTIKQRQAIDLVASGKTDTEVAKEIGVGRDTVCRWRNHDVEFKKAIDAHLDLLAIYTRVGRPEEALQVFDLLKKYLPPNCFRLVINWLKLENTFLLK